jgi:hydroxymethylbilane synthase
VRAAKSCSMSRSQDAPRAGEVIVAAARTLARMRTYVKTAVPREKRAPVLRELMRIPVEELAAMSPVAAEHRIEHSVSALRDAKGAETNVLVCASRASALAMRQTRIVAAKLAQLGIASTIINVTTMGDRVQDRSLAAIGSDSLFVKELEYALRDGRAQYAVHSCKDLPSTLPDDMRLAAISSREDPRDAFCSERYASFADLPAGARVGTSSLRRRAQLACLRADLDYVDIRGNVDTRLRKLRDGQYDAIVLACAGLRRLAVSATHTVPFEVTTMVPSVGQGALAVEVRSDDAALAQLLRNAINDELAERAILCERAALAALQGGCQAPIGIHARYERDQLIVDAVIANPDGSSAVREQARQDAATSEAAQEIGIALARKMLDRGAQRILEACPRPAPSAAKEQQRS